MNITKRAALAFALVLGVGCIASVGCQTKKDLVAVEETSVPWPTPTNQEPQVDYLENKFTSWNRVQAARMQEADAWNQRTSLMLQQLLDQQEYHEQMQKLQQMQQQQIQQIQQQMRQWSGQPQ